MTDKTKSLLTMQTNPNFRYSQSSLNSTESSENDYNLYCFSQGYKNHEKGYWRGVLRNKNVDFDLRFNKDWNRRIELEGDDFEKGDSLLQSSTQFSNEFIKFVNDNEIAWDFGRFQNFKKKQMQSGVKKQKNKEWLLSNGVKRNAGAVDLRTQNYKQFEENEKNKELKKAALYNQGKLYEVKTGYLAGKQYQYSDNKGTAEKLIKSLKTASDTYKTFNTQTESTNINEQRGSYGTYGTADKNKRIEISFTGDKSPKDFQKGNLETEYTSSQYQKPKFDKNISASGKGAKDKSYDIFKNQGIQSKYQIQSDKKQYTRGTIDQGDKKVSPKPFELKSSYGTGYTTSKKSLQEFKYGQKGTYSDQKDNLYVKRSSDVDRPANLGRLEISVEKKKKEKEEREPGSRTYEKLYSSKKRKLSYDKDGKPLTNTARLNVSTEKKKPPRERIDNFSRLEVSMDQNNRPTFQRKGSSDFVRTESAKLGPKKDYDTTVSKQIKTEKKLQIDKKYDITKQKTEPFTFNKTDYKKTKPQQTLQAISTYSRTKLQQTPQQTHEISYLKKQPQGQSLSQQKLLKTSYTSRTTQQQIKPSPYHTSKPKDYSKQGLYDKTSKQTTYATSGQTKPQIDYSKYTKYQSYTDQKLKGISKIEDKYKQQQKPSLVKKFDFTDKKEKPKEFRKQQTTYDLQKLTKKTQVGKPGQYTIQERRSDDRPENLGRLEVSVEKKKKEKVERKPGSRTHERLCSSKKRKLSYDKDGKPLKNTARLNVSTEKKKEKRERLDNIGRLEISAEKKKKERVERKPGSRKHDRIHSSKKKRKISYDKDGKPLTNTARLNVSTEKKKPPRERLDNLSKLDISVEGKKKPRLERKPGSRKHDRIHSSKKKRKISYDKDGKPLTNTARLNVSTEKKKPPRERLVNYSRLEVSVEGKKKEKIERKPTSRKHERVLSSKKKRKISYDKDGKPLTNTARLNVSTEKKKPPRERLDNYSRLEVSVEGKKKEKIERKPTSRKHDRVLSSKKKRKISYDSQGRPLTNTSRLKVGFEKNKLKYIETDEYDQSKNKDRFDTFIKTKTEFALKKYQTTSKQYGQKQGTQGISSFSLYDKYPTQKPQDKTSLRIQPNQYQKYQKPQEQKISSTQHIRQYSGLDKMQSIDTTKPSYKYPVSGKKEISSYERGIKRYPTSNYLSQAQTSTSYQKNKQYGIKPDYQHYDISSRTQSQQGTYKDNVGTYTSGSSQLNTAATRSKYGRMNKSVEGSNKFLFGDKKPYGDKISNITQDTKKYIAPGQRASSAPKKPAGPDRRRHTGYQQTPNKISQDGRKPSDTVKIDLSKYLQKQPSTAQKAKPNDKSNVPEIYEYYPLSKTAQKIQLIKPKKSSITGTNVQYQSQTGKKEKYKTPNISESDIYEYNPKKSYKGITDKSRAININLDKYTSGRGQRDKFNTLQFKSVKTPSYSYQKDRNITYGDNARAGQALNNRYQLSPSSEENKKDSSQRTRTNQNNRYSSVGPSSDRRGMAYFKLQFLTTKQVCEKFWKQIDNGELSSSMFDPPMRYSVTASKLKNFLSPEKNRQSKFSMSNENTEFTAKHNNLGGYSGKFGNKEMSNSTSESYLKNTREVRQSYKSGFN